MVRKRRLSVPLAEVELEMIHSVAEAKGETIAVLVRRWIREVHAKHIEKSTK